MDDRKRLVSIEMTMEEWDSLGFGVYEPDAIGAARYADVSARRYARDLEGRARDRIAQATPGAAGRRAAARAEAEARVPVLDQFGRMAIEAELTWLLREFEAGTLDVDHLGRGPGCRQGRMPEGFVVTLTPRISDGGSAFHFSISPSVWFESTELPLRDEDREWFIAAVERATGRPPRMVWNDGPSRWVSVAFR